MTHAREAARKAVLATSLRPVAKAIGISHQTLAAYLDNPDGATRKTQAKVEEWASGTEQGTAADLLGFDAELARVNALDVEESVRAWKIAEVAAGYRAEAMARDAAAAELRARALLGGEQGTQARSTSADVGQTIPLTRREDAEPGQSGRGGGRGS